MDAATGKLMSHVSDISSLLRPSALLSCQYACTPCYISTAHLTTNVGEQLGCDVHDTLLEPAAAALCVRQRHQVSVLVGVLVGLQGQHPPLWPPAEHLGVGGVVRSVLQGWGCCKSVFVDTELALNFSLIH